MQQYLPDSFGIDHIIKQPKARVISLDLDDERNQALVRGWIVSPQCFWAHFGVPCGTSRRARDRPMSDSHHGPRPFRSSQWPDGLPDLPERHLPRLRAANRLYAFMRDTLLALRGSPVLWTVENPLALLPLGRHHLLACSSRCIRAALRRVSPLHVRRRAA